MNKSKLRYLIILFAIMNLYFIYNSGGKPQVRILNKDNSVYLLSTDTLEIEPFNYTVLNDEEFVDEIISVLRQGIQEEYLGTIPELLKIIYYTNDSRNIVINFSDDYYTLEPKDQMILISSVVRSLTSYSLVESVEFFVEGVPFKGEDNRAVGRFYREDVFVSMEESFENLSTKWVQIYYPDMKSLRLNYERIELTVDNNKKIEESIILFMMEKKKYNVFPEGTKLIDVYTHDRVCYVDFSEEFENGVFPGNFTSELVVYSIVNSLVDLDDVSRVQFLIEGRLVNDFHGIINLERLLSKNYLIIE